MKTMKFVIMVITLLLAYAINYVTNGTFIMTHAFFALHAGISGLLLASVLIVCAIGKEDALNKYGKLLIRVLRFTVALAITSLVGFIATLIVEVDFYVAYLLLTFGQCMYNLEYVESESVEFIREKFSHIKLRSINGKHINTKKNSEGDGNYVRLSDEELQAFEDADVMDKYEDDQDLLEDAEESIDELIPLPEEAPNPSATDEVMKN